MPKKKTNEEFIKEVYELVGDEYSFLEEYRGSQNKIKVIYNKCGNIYKVTPCSFLQDRRCSRCSMNTAGLKHRKTHKQFKEEVFNLISDEYTLLEEYKGVKSKIRVRHNTCGNIYKVRPDVFLRGGRCSKCAGLKNKTTEEFKQEVFDLIGNEYSVLGKYKNTRTKIKMKHNICGHEYYINPNSFLHGTRCPICKSFKGEEKIAKYLIKNNIKFETQKTFKDLKDKGFLRFDFYLPEYNLLIEYDGKQHFEPVDFSGNNPEQAEENFKNRKIRDWMKNNYCKENNIKLLRIKYNDFKNIKKILKEEFTYS